MKRKVKRVSWAYLALLVTMIVYSCTEDFQNPEPAISEVQFNMPLSSGDGGRTANDLDGVRYVLFSVESEDGSRPYEKEQLPLINLNGEYITDAVPLQVGNHRLTDFFLLDGDGNALFATPQLGSAYADLVEKPLPIEFEVKEEETTHLEPEVLSTEESTAEDFGYATFGFKIVEYFKFLLSVVVEDGSEGAYQPVGANLVIEAGGEEVLAKSLSADENEILVKDDGYDSYMVRISKDGYEDFSNMYSSEALRKHVSGNALTVVMSKIQQEDLLFGMANYESTGTVYFGTINYEGTEEEVGSYITGFPYVVSFNKSKQYYYFDSSNGFYVFDANANMVMHSSENFRNPAFSESEELFYGVYHDTQHNYYYLATMDLSGNLTRLSTLSEDSDNTYDLTTLWATYDPQNNYYSTRITEHNDTGLHDQYLLVYDIDNQSFNLVDITDAKLSDSRMIFVDGSLYGFGMDNSTGFHQLISMDYTGLETSIKSFEDHTTFDNRGISYDEENEFFINSSSDELYFLEKDGIIVNSIDGLESHYLTYFRPIK